MDKINRIKEIEGKCNHTYLTGVYLAINAISDSYLLLDGPPYCGYDKIFCVQGTHDLFSQIFRRDSKHRICCSGVSGDRLVYDRTDHLITLLKKISHEKECSALFLCSMPVAKALGIDYNQIINKVQPKIEKPLIQIPSQTMNSDWLQGYEETLLAIAKKIKLNNKSTKDRNVALVGYFFDRNEGDNIGNIAELKRIFKELSLNLVSVWLDGSSFDSLKNIEKAKTIISLPYARKAAKEIASKTNANLIELYLPFGIRKTKEFILQIAKSLNVIDKAKIFIKKELDEVIPLISSLIPKYFQGKKFLINGDPYLCAAISDSLIELGAEIKKNILFCTKDLNKNFPNRPALYEPRYGDIFDMDISDINIIIGNSQMRNILKLKGNEKNYVEIGYPSENLHLLTMSPYFGFKGFINFVNRIINNSRQIKWKK